MIYLLFAPERCGCECVSMFQQSPAGQSEERGGVFATHSGEETQAEITPGGPACPPGLLCGAGASATGHDWSVGAA